MPFMFGDIVIFTWEIYAVINRNVSFYSGF